MANGTVKSATSKPKIEVRAPPAGRHPDSLLKNSVTPVTAEVRRVMIAEAAYYIAEKRGFALGSDVEDWLLAERQIDAALSAEAPTRAA